MASPRKSPPPKDSFTEFRRCVQATKAALEVTLSSVKSVRQETAVRARLAVLEEMLTQSFEETSDHSAAALGLKLRNARIAAGLTQEQVASRAGVSIETYRNCEKNYRATSEEVLSKIAKVPELKFSVGETPSQTSHDKAPSWWIDARFEPLQMLQDLRHTLNGSGGRVEQSLMYLDHQSAADFMALSSGSHYARRHRELMPLDEVVATIKAQTGEQPVDIVALGPGDGRQEVAVTELMADSYDQPDIKLVLLDVSQPLLNAAYRRAADTFDKRRGVAVFALQGNFHHLPSFTQLHYRPAYSRRRKVVTMLGKTISNLDDELAFFRHNLAPFAAGDLVVIDFHEAAKPPWATNDSAFHKPVPPAHQEFLGGPLRRYCRDIDSVSFRYELGLNLVVPESYAVEANATVQTRSGSKHFTMFRIKRYEPSKLASALKDLGWELAGAFPYGTKVEERAQIMVLRKKK